SLDRTFPANNCSSSWGQDADAVTMKESRLKVLVRKKPGVQMHAGPSDGDFSIITHKLGNDQIDK
ncbi:MAG: hypothetical protein WBI13_00065, partial [Synechococcus sp.]